MLLFTHGYENSSRDLLKANMILNPFEQHSVKHNRISAPIFTWVYTCIWGRDLKDNTLWMLTMAIQYILFQANGTVKKEKNDDSKCNFLQQQSTK